MPGKSTVDAMLPLAIFLVLVLPVVLIGQQACGKSLHELQNWVKAEPRPVQRLSALPYPVFFDSTEQFNATHKFGPNPRYFLMESPAPRAFFCRLEHQLAQKIQVPFKFRLGSVQYVDWLEGKPGAAAY